MAATACEQHAARVIVDGANPTAETSWHVFGAADEIAAYSALSSVPLPGLYNMPSGKVCYIDSVQIEDVFPSSSDGQLSHKATARYSYQKPESDIGYEFEAGSQTVTITHALQTTSYSGGGRAAPNFQNGINVSSEGKIQGIDIEVPKFSFSLTINWPVDLVTRAYQLTVSDLVGKVNNGTYYDLPEGSVKFLGARGRTQGDRFPIVYRFEFSPPDSGTTIGDITVSPRQGWTYLDIYRATKADATAKKKVEFAHSVYVHKVYPAANFALLGLGTG